MALDEARRKMIRHALASHDVSALICALPANVLMLTGYFPIVGTSVAIVTADGRTVVLAPQDEEELAKSAHPDRVITFPTGSLEELISASQGLARPLQDALDSLHLSAGRIGYEAGPWLEPASYTAIHLYGNSLQSLLENTIPRATFFDARDLLHDLRKVHTSTEIQRIGTSCRIAADAFHHGASTLSAGLTEAKAAAAFRTPLYVTDPSLLDHARADGLVSCMSGPNAASAYGAYARSRGRSLQRGDLALVHCNSHVNGYWTDITRTYCLGPPSPRQKEMYDAIFAARDAAFSTVRPGVRAADVDRAARDVLNARGFGPAFKHPTGHGVGFAAIDHNAPPRLHPRSPDVLHEGMVFNIEPGIYLDNQGMRHCDMVAVTPTGYELLTPFHQDPRALVV